MRTIVAIIGVPATGKSTLMKALMEEYVGDWVDESIPYMSYVYSSYANAVVFGKYEDGEQYPGTDRLPLNVQPVAENFVRDHPNTRIIFEGDRLSSGTFLEFCADLPDTEFHIVHLQAASDIVNFRHKDRADTQNEIFLKGRETKYANIKKNFLLMDYITDHKHETPEDTKKIVSTILEWLK